MKRVFADAGHWIALINVEDEHYRRAVEWEKALTPFIIITHELTLSETLDFYARKGPYWRLRAVRFVEVLLQSPNILVEPVHGESFADGLQLFKKALDKEWSHPDCISFALMQKYNVEKALAHDRHFTQAGFTALLRESPELRG